MSDSFELKLNSPLTKEDWNKIFDAELEHTKKITYKTPSGKEVVFISLTELEEIKAEIENCHTLNIGKTSDFYNNGLYTAVKVLDNHIKELNNDNI